MSFLKAVVNLLATKYGQVTGGKYAKTSLGLGNDGDKKVEVGPLSNQLLFIKGTKEIARVSVAEVERYEIVSENPASVSLRLIWATGGESMIKISKVDKQGRRLAHDPVGKVLAALSNK